MNIYKLVRLLGIITYGLLALTFIFGILEWNFTTHRILAVLSIILASIHGIIVISIRRKRRKK